MVKNIKLELKPMPKLYLVIPIKNKKTKKQKLKKAKKNIKTLIQN